MSEHEKETQEADQNVKVFEQLKQKQTSKVDSGTAGGKDMNEEYFEEYCRLKVANHILLDRVQEIVDQKEDLIAKIKRLQVGSLYPRRMRTRF